MIKEVHLFIEGVDDDRSTKELLRELYPELDDQEGVRLVRHEVADWPAEPFVHASVTLKVRHGLALRTDNCLVRQGSVCGRRLLLVLVKGR